jgi:hypothetical protein
MKTLHGWMRDMHLYLGLFLCPAILIFAVSTLWLNHPGPSEPAAPTDGNASTPPVTIELSGEVGTLDQARDILSQLQVTGEIDYLHHDAKTERLRIPVLKPGLRTEVEVDLRARTAVVARRQQGLAAALIYLHRMPGPHNASLRGNWIYMVWWSALADTVVYGLLALTLSGLYLWWRLRPQRKLGWLMLGMGVGSAAVLALALCTA